MKCLVKGIESAGRSVKRLPPPPSVGFSAPSVDQVSMPTDA